MRVKLVKNSVLSNESGIEIPGYSKLPKVSRRNNIPRVAYELLLHSMILLYTNHNKTSVENMADVDYNSSSHFPLNALVYMPKVKESSACTACPILADRLRQRVLAIG